MNQRWLRGSAAKGGSAPSRSVINRASRGLLLWLGLAVCSTSQGQVVHDAHTDCLSCHPHGAISPPAAAAPTAAPAATVVATKAGAQALAFQASPLQPDTPVGQTKPRPKPQGRGLSSECMVCHQGPRRNAADRAVKLPEWIGTGSSHVDGMFLERTRPFARTIDIGRRGTVVLQANCNGCHDIHAKEDPARLRPTAFDERGQVLKVKRTTVAQVCFGCHAGTEAARLSKGEADIGALFLRGTGSAHRPGTRAADVKGVPSLRLGLFKGSLDCTSCHTNPSPGGPKGPHFSSFPHLLQAAYGRESDLANSGERNNDLCYLCHDRSSILGNQTFPLHAQHVQGFSKTQPAPAVPGRAPQWKDPFMRQSGASGLPRTVSLNPGFGRPTACATCHDPHGSPKSPSLIRFDPIVVTRSSMGIIDFRRTGLGRGSCTLSCHGYDHVQARY